MINYFCINGQTGFQTMKFMRDFSHLEAHVYPKYMAVEVSDWYGYGHLTLLKIIKGPFDKRFLVMLFKFCENTCEWKSMWKYVLWCLNNNFHCLNTNLTGPKPPKNGDEF